MAAVIDERWCRNLRVIDLGSRIIAGFHSWLLLKERYVLAEAVHGAKLRKLSFYLWLEQ